MNGGKFESSGFGLTLTKMLCALLHQSGFDPCFLPHCFNHLSFVLSLFPPPYVVSIARGGTMVYMSPESRAGKGPREQRVTHDFFAVGVMCYKMLSNTFPFDIKNNFQSIAGIMKDDEEPEVMPEHYKVKTHILKRCCPDEDAVDFISSLLHVQPNLRLGHDKGELGLWGGGGADSSQIIQLQ